MRNFLYGLITVILGAFIHFIFNRYLSGYGVTPQLLLLIVVAHGFLLGPMMGEILGFSWGLMMDSIGVSFFGLESLLLALAGYLAGKLRKRVASQRPTAQIFIALGATAYYFGTSSLVTYVLESTLLSISWVAIFLGAVFNVLLVMAVFWVVEWWILIWKINQEHI